MVIKYKLGIIIYSSFNEMKCVFNKLSNTRRNLLRYSLQLYYYLS